jgi:hypothetical protein
MREIKFKYLVKRNSNGHIFSKIFTLAQIEDGDVNQWIKINIICRSELYKLQYTGRKDKKNKEIYANDILRTPHDSELKYLYHMS